VEWAWGRRKEKETEEKEKERGLSVVGKNMREEEDEDQRKVKFFPPGALFFSLQRQFFQAFGSENFTLPSYDISINFFKKFIKHLYYSIKIKTY
jgi:hypothetical protein